jgi:general secretion pathway protein D
VRNGEWAVVAGLLNSSQAKTISGLAGLSRVPLVGPLFSKRGRDETENQVLVVLKPVLLSLPPTEAVTTPIWLGTEQRPRAPL